MNATAILPAVVALILGLMVGYLLAAARLRSSSEGRLREAESSRAGLEATVNELRSQLEQLRTGQTELHSRLESEQQQRAAAQTALEKSEENLAAQRQALEETKSDMKAVFQALASETLTQTTAQFLKLAETKFEGLHQGASAELDTRRVAIEGLVSPLAETLKTLQSHLTQIESSRQEAYGELRTQVKQLVDANRDLRQETGTLVSALSQPRVRGSWGELTLRNAVELAGMSSHCDFEEQSTLAGEEGGLRPDLIVHLPGGRDIAVDAKVPLSAFTTASQAASEEERQRAMDKHVQLVRDHIQRLSSKAYWSHLQPAPEMVILFMPGESFFSAALERDRGLIQDALQKRVLLASPTSLIATLRAIAYGWRQHQMEVNAAQISQLGRELYDRLTKFVEHISDLGKGLDKAGAAYNRAVGSFSERLMPSARRLRELGASADAELPALEPTEVELRLPPASEKAPEQG